MTIQPTPTRLDRIGKTARSAAPMAALAVAILLAQTVLNEPGATPPAPLSAPASPPSAAESAAAADPDQTATCRPEPSSGHPRVFGFPSPVQAGSGAGSGAGSVAGSVAGSRSAV